LEQAYAQKTEPPQTNLFGNLWGLRTELAEFGITSGLVNTSEILGNTTGGIHRGAAYEGALQLSLGLDLDKAAGWAGATFKVSAYQINGRNLSADNLATLQTASGMEAQRSTRLWELWLDQALLNGKLNVKIGQQSLDQEFMVSAGSTVFLNGAMGWPIIPAYDLYASGPAYPLASLGVRIQAPITDAFVILAGLFNDNPSSGAGFADASQLRGATQSGTSFNLHAGALAIAELQYSATPFTYAGQPLRGVYKLGAWFDTAKFADQNNNTPKMHPTNWSLYTVIDQTLWQPKPAQPRAISVFARIIAAPADRNLVGFSLNAGLTLKQPIPSRDNDVLGIGGGLATIRHPNAYPATTPTPSNESFVEITYQAQITPWLTLQPDIQYTVHPGGGIANPLDSGKRIGDEWVFGIRSTLVF
jgi:porin